MTDEQAKALFETDLPLKEAAKLLKVRGQTLYNKWRSLYPAEQLRERRSRLCRQHKLGKRNPQAGRKGNQAAHWRGGKPVRDGKGYLLVAKPEWFTGRPASKYVYQHHVVYCAAHGLSEIPKGYVVHHRNGNKLDNSLENLELMTTDEHGRLHVPRGVKVGHQRRKFNDHPARE